MKAIKVEYTVKQEFAETNKANIQTVIEELKKLNRTDVMYSAWVKEDGKSFVHVFVSNEGTSNPLTEFDSFKEFQTQLKENVEISPEATELGQVGASFDLN